MWEGNNLNVWVTVGKASEPGERDTKNSGGRTLKNGPNADGGFCGEGMKPPQKVVEGILGPGRFGW